MSGKDLKSTKHFIEERWYDLVERISLVDPLVDVLRQEGVLNQNEYEKIRVGETRAEQARRLLDAVIHKGKRAMDVLQEALWKHDSYLMGELDR